MSYCGTFSTLDLTPLDLILLDLILEVISFRSYSIRSYSNLPIRSYSIRSYSCLPFAKYQLRLNTDKTEFSFFGGENHNIAKIKKLGSFLDYIEDIENRNRLCWIALGKYSSLG